MYVDPSGDEATGANFTATDLRAVYLARDNNFLYCMIVVYDGTP